MKLHNSFPDATTSKLSRVTILVHTANRPQQLYRMLRYYASCAEAAHCCFLIADGSSAEHAEAFDRMMRDGLFKIDYLMVRSPPTVAFSERIGRAVAQVTTEFIMLAADDDFYFLPWVVANVGQLDARPDLAAVIGDYFLFSLGGFSAFSHSIAIEGGVAERFSIPYLEGATPDDRIVEIGNNPNGVQTIAWYALHRTSTLKRIFDHASRFELPLLLFERFFTIAQAASGKTHFSPDIFLARQADVSPDDRSWRAEPMGYAAHRDDLETLHDCARSFLCEVLGFDEARAAGLATQAYAHEIEMMRQADRRRWLRRIVKNIGLRRWLNRFRQAAPPPPRDPRLPERCDPEELKRLGDRVRVACLPDPVS